MFPHIDRKWSNAQMTRTWWCDSATTAASSASQMSPGTDRYSSWCRGTFISIIWFTIVTTSLFTLKVHYFFENTLYNIINVILRSAEMRATKFKGCGFVVMHFLMRNLFFVWKMWICYGTLTWFGLDDFVQSKLSIRECYRCYDVRSFPFSNP